jgi:hypothetical protein
MSRSRQSNYREKSSNYRRRDAAVISVMAPHDQRHHPFEDETVEEETSKMDDNTRTPGTVVRLFTPDDRGRTSPNDNGIRQLEGSLLTFSDKEFYVGSGRSKEKMPLGTRFIALETTALWKRWQDARIVETAVEVGGRYPTRAQLGHLDQSQWPDGPGGAPADVWQDSREVKLLRESDYSPFVFCSSSAGGRSAVDALRNSMANARVLRPGQYPIIELAWQSMNTRFGTKAKPDLHIVDWWRPEAPSIAPTDDSVA